MFIVWWVGSICCDLVVSWLTSQNVPKPEPAQTKPKRPLVSSQSVVSVKAVTIKFYRKIILWSKLILKLLLKNWVYTYGKGGVIRVKMANFSKLYYLWLWLIKHAAKMATCMQSPLTLGWRYHTAQSSTQQLNCFQVLYLPGTEYFKLWRNLRATYLVVPMACRLYFLNG